MGNNPIMGNPIAFDFSLIFISAFYFAVLLLGFACLIQLFRFLTKGIKAFTIYIDKNQAKKDESQSPQ